MKSIQISVSVLSLLFLLSVTTVAQSNFKKGYIVTVAGDTLRGYIDDREWYRNPNEFSFKALLTASSAMRYAINNSTFVEVEGYAIYQRFPVFVSMNEVRFERLTESTSQPEIQDTVFLKLLVKGQKLNLYSYRDQLKQRFYVLENGSSRPLELGYRLARIEGNVITFPSFRQQLITLAEKLSDSSAAFRPAIEKSDYLEADLVKLLNLINGNAMTATIASRAKAKANRYFVAVGVNHSTMKYSGENTITADGVDDNDNRLYKNRKTSSLRPLVAIGTDFYFQPEVQKIFIKVDIVAAGMQSQVSSLYKFSTYSAEELSNTYQLSALILTMRAQLMINILNKESIQWYLGAGPSMNYFVPFKNEMFQKTNQQNPPYTDRQLDDYMFVKKFFASVVVSAGVTLKKKWDLSFCRHNTVELNNNMASQTSSKYAASQLIIAYKLGK